MALLCRLKLVLGVMESGMGIILAVNPPNQVLGVLHGLPHPRLQGSSRVG